MRPDDLPAVPAGLPWRIVLGIDPGTVVVGYGALVLRESGPRLLAAGVLRAPRSNPAPERLGKLRIAIDDLLARLRPDVVVVEGAFTNKNAKSALRVGEGRGVAISSAAARGAEVVELPPAVAKQSLVGHGGASKDQVARMVAQELRLAEPPAPHDATDALALALTWVHRSRLSGRL